MRAHVDTGSIVTFHEKSKDKKSIYIRNWLVHAGDRDCGCNLHVEYWVVVGDSVPHPGA